MSLEDTVIAGKNQIADLYGRRNATGYYESLVNDGFLPLTVKGLTTQKGKALLNLATWVYLSGHVSRKAFAPHVCGKNEFLEYLLKSYFQNLGRKFRHVRDDEQGGSLILAQNSGAFGRLMYTMGIQSNAPFPKRGIGSRLRKPHFDNELPHYFFDILKSFPAGGVEAQEKREILYDIVRILFRDRLKLERDSKQRQEIYLGLNQHSSREMAFHYAQSILDFLSQAFRTLYRNDLMVHSYIHVTHAKGNLYDCRIRITQKQIGYLATRNPPILDFTAHY